MRKIAKSESVCAWKKAAQEILRSIVNLVTIAL